MNTSPTSVETPDFDFLTSDADAPSPRSRRRFDPKLVAVGALGLALALFVVQKRRAGQSTPPQVKVALVKRQTVRQTVSATGTLQAFTTVDVKSKAGGTILQMAVEEGSRVKRGQLIAVIDRQDTSAALRQANADVAAARANLEKAQATASQQQQNLGPQLRQSQEGVAAAAAKLAQARENLALEATTNPAAISQAAQTVAASRAKLDQSRAALVIERRTREAAVREASAGVNTARIKLVQAQQTAKTQPTLSRSSVEGARASVAASQATLRAAQQGLAQLQSATQPQERAQTQAQVDQAKSNLLVAQTTLTRQKSLYNQGFVAQSLVDTAQNSADTAQAALETAQSKLDTLQAQQSAARSQSQAQVEAARSNWEQAQANLRQAQANSVQVPLTQGDVSAARAALLQSQATLATAQANLRQVAVKQGDVQSSLASLSQAQSSLQTARANTRQISVKRSDVDSALAALRQSQASLQSTQTNRLGVAASEQDVQSARAQLARAQVTAQNAAQNLSQTRVVAPRDGIVLQKYVDTGTIIQSGQSGISGGTSIVQLAQVDRMFVDVSVDEADISLIKPGQNVTVTLDAYPNDPKRGVVRKIYPLAAVTSNVTYIHVQVELDPRDVNAKLRPAMNATCDFSVAQSTGALVVPNAAVKDEPQGSVVTVIKNPQAPLYLPDNQRKTSVVVGVRGNDAVEIKSGLKEGETVVTQIVASASDSSAAAGGSNGSRSLMGGGPPGGGGGRR